MTTHFDSQKQHAAQLEAFLPDQPGRLRRLLSQVPGLSVESSYEGQLETGAGQAQLRIEPGDVLHVVHRPPAVPDPGEALQRSGQLPGNLRFSIDRSGMNLLADTHLDGEVHLQRSFAEIAAGFTAALQATTTDDQTQTPPIPSEKVSRALEESCFEGEEMVVQLDDGWELSPRIDGTSTAVHLTIDGPRLRLQRPVVVDLPSKADLKAVACQALRYNSQLRMVRLVWRDDQIVAEAWLHDQQVTGHWILTTARAVAVAAKHTFIALEILARQEAVAGLYHKVIDQES